MSVQDNLHLPSAAADMRTIVKNTFIEVDSGESEGSVTVSSRSRALTDTGVEWGTPGSKPRGMNSLDFNNDQETIRRSRDDSEVGSLGRESLRSIEEEIRASRLSNASTSRLRSVPEVGEIILESEEAEWADAVDGWRAQASGKDADMGLLEAPVGDSAEAWDNHAEALEAEVARLSALMTQYQLRAQKARSAASAARKQAANKIPPATQRSEGRVRMVIPEANYVASSATPAGVVKPPGNFLAQPATQLSKPPGDLSTGGNSTTEPIPLPEVAEVAGDTPFKEDQMPTIAEEERTTVLIRNLPNETTRDMLVTLLTSNGFGGTFNFVYLPTDFKNWSGFGYAFVNFMTHEKASQCMQFFEGYTRWEGPWDKACNVVWSGPHQGLDAHVTRYQNSPVMHHLVPDEVKPALYTSSGERLPFPSPTKKIRAPRVRHGAAPWQGDGAASPTAHAKA